MQDMREAEGILRRTQGEGECRAVLIRCAGSSAPAPPTGVRVVCLAGPVDINELSDRAERISARYGEHLGIERDGDWFLLKLQEELGELTQSYLQVTGRARTKGLSEAEIREGFELEFADVLCQLLLLARHHEVDVPAAIERKWLIREAHLNGPAGRS
jgi:NTP pyrophosphatase (non-canonical NTP hydrolase)